MRVSQDWTSTPITFIKRLHFSQLEIVGSYAKPAFSFSLIIVLEKMYFYNESIHGWIAEYIFMQN